MAIIHNCFMCTEKILGIDSRHLNSFRLFCEILEIPQYGNVDKKFEIGYCHRCEERILNIRDMFEELEKLEKKILDEKHLMELQLKESIQHYHPENSSQELKSEIVTELNSTSIESMLEKIRKNQVARKFRSQRRINIMEGVTIPKLTTPKGPNQESAENVDVIGASIASVYDSDQDGHNSQKCFVDVNDRIGTRRTAKEAAPHNSLNSWNFSNIPESAVKLETVTVEYPTVCRDPLDDAVPSLDFGHQTDPIDDHSEEKPNVDCQFEEANFLFQHIPQGGEANRTLICGNCGTCLNNYDELNSHECSHMNRNQSHIPTMVIDDNAGTQKWIKKQPKTPYYKRPRKCDECGKVLSSLKTWSNHVLLVHRGQSKFKCTICDHGSMTSKDMRTHMLIHSSARNFKCPLCDKTFKQKSSRDRHIRTHNRRKNVEVLQP